MREANKSTSGWKTAMEPNVAVQRVLVVNPPNKPFTETSLLIEPIDALSLATFVKKSGFIVKFLDMDVKKQEPEMIRECLRSFSPQALVIPFDYHIPLHTTDSIPGIQEICRIAKEESKEDKRGIKVIIGGKTAKQEPLTFLSSGADVVVNGELELATVELLKLTRWDDESLSKIKGISYLSEGQLKSTGAFSELIDLDLLPMPDRSLADLNDYIDVRAIWTSRGCVGNCAFCATPGYWGKWRARSPSLVADEIEYLVESYGAKKILFLDDNATVDKRRMQAICTEIIARKIKVSLGCLGSISCYDKPTIELMAKAGFKWIHYGIESGDEQVRRMHGKMMTDEQIKKAVFETKKAGLRVRASFIFDLPGTTCESMKKTAKMILELQPDEIRGHYLACRALTGFYDLYKGKSATSDKPLSQYIHKNKPQLALAGYPEEMLLEDVKSLTEELEKKGYVVVSEAEEWRDLTLLREKSPEMKIIAFCPAKYGICWGEEE